MDKITSVLIALSVAVLINQISAQNSKMLRGLPPIDADLLLQGEYRNTFLETANKTNMTQELKDYFLNLKKEEGTLFVEEIQLLFKEIDWNTFSSAIINAFTDLSVQFSEKAKDKKHLSEMFNLITKFGFVN